VNRKFIVFLFFSSTLVSSLLAENSYPSLLNVEIGQKYDYQDGIFNMDDNRPSTQFKVPNYGETKEYFPEYQVILFNSNKNVSSVSAERAVENYEVCNHLRLKVKPLIDKRFPDHYKKSDGNKAVQLPYLNAYVREGDNIFYILSCRGSYGPFATLHFEMRGEKEDKEMKKYYTEFFSSKD